jgi:hypothetical protein
MIVVIPIALGVPASFVFIPPAMVGAPAALTGFAEIVTRVFGLPALIAMMGNGLVELVICVDDAALAIVVIGADQRRPGEQQECRDCCGCKRRGFER